MNKKRIRINRYYFRRFLFLNLVFMLIIGGAWIYTIFQHFETRSEASKTALLKREKHKITKNVDTAYRLIEYQKQHTEERLRQNLKLMVDQAHDIALNIYNTNRNKLSDRKIKQRIFTAIEPLRLENKRQYVFIINLKGVGVFYPKGTQLRRFIGKDLYNIKDKEGNYFVQDEINRMLHQNEAFIRYPNKKLLKISYIKKFTPYNWYMGTFAFVDDVKEELQKEALRKIKEISYNSHISIYNKKNRCIYNSQNASFLEDNSYKKKYAKKRTELIKHLKHITQKTGFRYIEYSGADSLHRTVYIKHIKEWDWIIGSGFNHSNIKLKINQSKKQLYQKVIRRSLMIIFIVICAILVFIWVAIFMNKKIIRHFNEFNSFFKEIINNKKVRIDTENQSFAELYKMGKYANTMADIREQREEALKEIALRAEESDRLKSAFLANMSHEIRTPMNAMIGFSELIQDDSLPVEVRQEFYEHIKNSSDVLLQLVNDIMDTSKIEAGELKITKKSVSINQLFDELSHSFDRIKTQRNKKHLQINFIKGSSDIASVVYTDPIRLKQILNNLIENAIKFTDESGSVTVCYQQNRNKLVFDVVDTGMGITREQQKIVFDRFRQADESHSRKFGGTGLGLSISKQLVLLLGGEMWVNSSVNYGSTFSFYIPYTQNNEAIDVLKVVDKNVIVPNLKNKQVLIIDNVEVNVLKLIHILGDTGAILHKAKNISKGIDLCKSNTYDLIILNIALQEANDRCLIEIRKHNPSSKIIALTTTDLPIDPARISKTKFAQCIVKPIISYYLFDMLEEVFDTY